MSVDTAPQTRHLSDIPGPPGNWLTGMAPALLRDTLGCLLDGLHRYGDTVAFRLGPRRGPLGRSVVAAYHPTDVHHILTAGDQVFSRRTVSFTVLTEVFGSGLLTTDGETWRRQRRTLQPLFTPRRVAAYAELMAAEAARIVTDAPTAPRVADLHELMQRYTLRVVGRALFGQDVDDAVPVLADLVPRLSDLARLRTMQIARAPLGWPTPRNRRLSRLRVAQYRLVDEILAKRAGRPDGGDDLVSRLAAARDPETGAALSNQEIRDQALIFLMAGHETTAGALTFTLHQLGQHPELQERAASDDAYARAAVQEGMRLFPPAYATERVAAADTEIGGYAIPRGTPVLVSPWVTHRHPGIWPDPLRFDPGRFSGGRERPDPAQRYAYFPFGGGPRSCIGEHFALLEATVLLRALLGRYRVTCADQPLELAPMITLRPTGPVRATLTTR